MMKNEDQLSEHFRQVLQNHEEPYVLGSWERFQRYKSLKTRIRKQKIFLAIAASVLLILTLAFSWMNIDSLPDEQIAGNQQNEQPDITESESPPPPPEPERIPSVDPEEWDEHTGPAHETSNNRDETGMAESSAANFTRATSPVSRKSVPQQTLESTGRLPLSGISGTITNNLNEPGSHFFSSSVLKNTSSAEFVRAEDIRHTTGRSNQKDLVFSVAYASVMNIHDSRTDPGSGGGFYTDWNFSRNVTVSSGVFIAQNHLKFDKGGGSRLAEDFNHEGATTLSTDDLASVQLELVNLEIPLNLRYSLTDELSVSAGISSMAFLKEQYNYNFEYEQRVQVFDGSETTGVRPASRVTTFRTTQTQSEPALERMNWAAFYTFSVGYRQEVFKRYAASLEPFVKIPAGRVTSRGITYTSGGIQLKVSF